MLFFHLGGVLWLFRWVFRDPKVDVRFLLGGALLPDVFDMAVGTVILARRYATGELWFHSLALAGLYMSAVLLMTRRGRRRRAWMALGVGWFFHLLIDGMWVREDVFLWPFFGWEIEAGQAPYWQQAWERAATDPWRWLKEALGAVYLTWLWFALGLNHPERRARVRETGRLPSYVAPSS